MGSPGNQQHQKLKKTGTPHIMNNHAILTGSLIPTIHAEGHTLTIDIAQQLDTVRIGLNSVIDDDPAIGINHLLVYRPLARVRADEEPTGVEVIGYSPTSGRLIRIIIATHHVLARSATDTERAAHQLMEVLAGVASALPLAVLPRTDSALAR